MQVIETDCKNDTTRTYYKSVKTCRVFRQDELEELKKLGIALKIVATARVEKY